MGKKNENKRMVKKAIKSVIAAEANRVDNAAQLGVHIIAKAAPQQETAMMRAFRIAATK